jgi:hypothetical protein
MAHHNTGKRTRSDRKRNARLRWVLAGFCIAFAVVTLPPVFGWGWGLYNHVMDIPKVSAFPWAEPTQTAFEARIGVSSGLFQTSILLIAGIWGLVVIKKEEAGIVLQDAQERVMLCMATVSLVSSCVSHVVFVHVMSAYAMVAADTKVVPDLTHRELAYGLVAQCITVLGGAAIGALTVASAKWIRRE